MKRLFNLLLFFLSTNLFAQEKEPKSRINQEYFNSLKNINSYQFSKNKETNQLAFKVKTGYLNLNYFDTKTDINNQTPKNIQFSAPLFGLGVEYLASPKWTIDTSLEQALLMEQTITSIYYSYQLNFNYALFGTIAPEKTISRVLNSQMIEENSFGGVKLSFGLRQYFLNAVNNTLSFSGIGGSVGYQMTLFKIPMELAVGMDMVSNGEKLITPQKLILNIYFY